MTGQHRAWTQVNGQAIRVHRAFARILGWSRSIKEMLALGIQIAEAIRLKAIGQNPKHEMARQVRGRLTPERIVPTGTKVTNIEIAQVRDLDVEFFVVRQGQTNLHTGHVGQAAWRFDRRALALLPSALLML